MSVYKRYFKVESGPFFDAVVEQQEVNKKARDTYFEIAAELGASTKKVWVGENSQLVALEFDGDVDRYLYKKVKNGWWPKKNTKQGREINDRLKAVKTIGSDELLVKVGLRGLGQYFSAMYMHRSYLLVIPTNPIVCYVLTPWEDIDPGALDQYKKDKGAKKSYSANMDHLLWTPPADFVEVKEWEMKKAIDEYNESIDKKAAA